MHAQIREEVSFTKGRIIVRGKLHSRGEHQARRLHPLLQAQPAHRRDRGQGQQPQPGDGMQQALAYAETLDVPFVFSSNGDGFLFHDRTGLTGPERETELALDEFPSPEELWQRYCAWKGLATPEPSHGRNSPTTTTAAASMPRYYQVNAINRTIEAMAKGQQPHFAGDGHRHRQDLHRLPDHLAAVEGQDKETHPVPRRPQHPGRPDQDQRLQAVRSGHDQDHQPQVNKSYEIYLSLYQAVTGTKKSRTSTSSSPRTSST
jgi:type I restriction enzyme, R subunit